MNRFDDQFMHGSFCWFIGVVEDRNDPKEMNRVRVRCYGYHSQDKSSIKTEDLPWATVMMPVTGASTSGIGSTPHALMQGSWVVGFFRDGPSAQDPIIMGSIGAMSIEEAKTNLGFYDPDGVYPIKEYLEKPDTNKAARATEYKESNVYKLKDTTREAPETAAPVSGSRGSWNELPVANNHAPEYPYNKVTESENGHVVEMDDTPNNLGLHQFHKSGTFEEIYNDGTRNVKVIGDDYEIIISNKQVYIKGNMDLTVDGNMNHLVKGNYNLEVGGEYNLNVGSNIKTFTGKSQTDTITGTHTLTAATAAVTYNNGLIKVTGGEVEASTVKLTTHKHTQPDTGPDAESQGDTGSPVKPS